MTDQFDAKLIDDAMQVVSQPSGKDDAGHRAREAVRHRASKAKRVMFNMYLIMTTFITVFVLGAVAFTYTEFKKPSTHVTDIRPCLYTDEKTGVQISGSREYSYPTNSIFGIDYRISNRVTVKTKLDVRGTAMNIAGISNDGYWSVYVDTGEQGIQMLKPASLYVIAMGKNTYIFPDSAFCR